MWNRIPAHAGKRVGTITLRRGIKTLDFAFKLLAPIGDCDIRYKITGNDDGMFAMI